MNALHASRTRPVCIDVLNPRAASELPPVMGQRLPVESAWVAIVGFEESGDAVRWQVQQLVKELSACRTQGVDALVRATAEPVWQFLSEFRLRPDAVLSFKANMLSHAVAAFCQLAERLDETMRLQAHAGNGIVVGHVSSSLNVERAGTMLQQLRAGATQGNVVILRCPPAWKSALPVWGQPRGDGALMSAVRDKLDPRRLFNPGRFLA